MKDFPTLWLAALLGLGCTPAPKTPGTLDVQLSGGNGVEATVPSSEFQDGWQLSFTRLLVVFSDLTVSSSADPAVIAQDGRSVLVDLAKAGPHDWASLSAPSGAYDRAAFSLRPATAQAVLVHATDVDLQDMVNGGFSMLAQGTLTQGTVRKSFSWGFQASGRYQACVLSLKVDANATTTTRLTFHGEQLFLESLSLAATPRLRAQAQADADVDHDGTITTVELGNTDGGTLSTVTVPSVGALTSIHTLRQYSEQALLRSLRLPGESRCGSISVDSPLYKDGGS